MKGFLVLVRIYIWILHVSFSNTLIHHTSGHSLHDEKANLTSSYIKLKRNFSVNTQ